MTVTRPSTAATAAALASSLAVALGVGLSACGGTAIDDTKQEISQSITDLYRATSRADGARICALMTPAARRATAKKRYSVDDPPHATCEARAHVIAQRQIDSGAGPDLANVHVSQINVLDDRATAVVRVGRADDSITLERVGGRWLVEASFT